MFFLIDIGHSKNSPGAVNKKHNTSEFLFNEALAKDVLADSHALDVKVELFYRSTYDALPREINARNPDVVLSLHCNAFDTKARGCETLYYHSSSKSKGIAQICQNNLVKALQAVDRGIKPKHADDRGGYQLRYVKAPIVIMEPFFIDNDMELENAYKNLDLLTYAILNSIDEISRQS